MRLAALLAAALPLWVGCADAPELSTFERGKQQFNQRQWDDALATFDEVILQQPDNSAAHAYRGRALANLDRLDQAITSYDTAVRLAPDDPEPYYLRSNVHRRLGDEVLADADYRKAKDLDPLSKLLYEHTLTTPETTTPHAATVEASPGDAEQPDPRATPGIFAASGSLQALLDEDDESDDARRQAAASPTLPAIGANAVRGVTTLPATSTAGVSDHEKAVGHSAGGGRASRPAAAVPRPSAVVDRRDNAPQPPPVFETSKRPDESSENGGAVGRGSRSPSITTGIMRLAPSEIPSQRDILSPRVGSPYAVHPSTDQRRGPKGHALSSGGSLTAPNVTLRSNPYLPRPSGGETAKTPPGLTATAPALPENSPLLNDVRPRRADRLNRSGLFKHDLFGLNAPPTRRPAAPANPFDPTHPSAVTKRPSGFPLSGTIGPGTVIGPGTAGSAPLRSNPFIPIQPDAFNPLSNTPIGGNPYGAPQPGANPFGLAHQGGHAPLAPPIPFGKLPGGSQPIAPSLNPFGTGGIGSPRRDGGLSGLYGQAPLLPGTLKPSGDLGWLLQPNSGRTLGPGFSSQSPLTQGVLNRSNVLSPPRSRITAPRARGGGSALDRTFETPFSRR